MEPFADVATISSTSHLDGRLVLVPKAGLPLLIEEGDELRLVPPAIDAPRTVHVELIDERPDGTALARFAEIDCIDVAKKVVGMHCLMPAKNVPESARLSVGCASKAFSGWRFADVESGLAGKIIDSWHSAGQDLCEAVLDGEECTHVFPLAGDFVLEVDSESCELSLRLPRGIFEI